jgi:arylsulfatase A-like enzyme
MKSRYACYFLPLAAGWMVVMPGWARQSGMTGHPNIILILSDDHSTNAIGCYGSRLIKTPNIDRMAADGMRFDNCYVTNALSGPSRACILTGKFGHVNGFTDNSQTFDGNQVTFPKLLRQAGYQTAMIGKWHLVSDPQGFDFWSILPGQGQYYQPEFIENGRHIVEKGYVTDVITDKAIHWLSTCDKSKPFVLLYYHKAPHRNWMPAQRHLGMFDKTVFPEPDNLADTYESRGEAARRQEMEIGRDMRLTWDLKVPDQERRNLGPVAGIDMGEALLPKNEQGSILQYRAAYNRMTESEKQHWDSAYLPRIEDYYGKSRTPDELLRWKYQQYMRDYLATVMALDENIGRLIGYLSQTGELDNTIIIYSSDQGFFLGEHGWFDKRFMYDESLRMPLIIRYPKTVNRGSVSDAICMNVDFAPTLLDMAGVKVPDDMQGKSLKPILEHKGKTPRGWRKAAYYHYFEYPAEHSVKRHYGIRTARYKLIHFYNDIDQWEMYDLKADPHEMHNLYDKPRYAFLRKKLTAILEQQQKLYHDNSK